MVGVAAIFLGLDIGTSAVKAVLVNSEGAIVATASATLTSSHPNPGWSEQEPDDWCAAAASACNELSHRDSKSWQNVQAIGLSGQMHGAVLLDENHKPLRPAILWNDGRSQAQCTALNQALPALETRAGISAMPGFTAPKIMWCWQNESDNHSRIAHILLPKDYVRLWLTGELATDMADAAGTLWLDQSKRRWNEALCTATNTNPAWLPRLLEGTGISGGLRHSIAKELGLKEGIPVAAGGGDAATGALGVGAINEGDAFASLGTSGQLFVVNDSYRPAPDTAVHCYAHCVPERWFQMAAMLNGASPMAWFANINDINVEMLLNEAEQATQTLLFLPYLAGERTPHNDASIRGCFYGLSPDSTRADMSRAVVNAIAWTFCDAKRCMEMAGTVLRSIAAIGGGARSDFVLQTMADAMDVTIRRYADAEAGPALGAARLAMVANGSHSLEDVAQKPPLDATFKPRAAQKAHHDESLAQWRSLYQTLKPFANS